jgi:hypothetical protein
MKLLFLMTGEMGAAVSVSSHIQWRNITPVMMGGATYRVPLQQHSGWGYIAPMSAIPNWRKSAISPLTVKAACL